MRKLFHFALLLFSVALRAQTVISNVYVQSSTATTATIVWTTSTPSTSQIKYGTDNTLPYANNVNYTLVTSHSMTLTILNATQPYYFAVVSVDGLNHSAQSSTYQFALCGQPYAPVTGTINQFYYSGTYTMTWNPPAGSSGQATVCGQPIQTTITGNLNLAGSFSSQVADSLKVTPGPGTWTVAVADIGDISPISVTLPLSATTQDISAQLQAAAAETSLVGVIANNNTDHCWPAFMCSGGGSGTVNVGTTGQLAYYAASGTAVSGENYASIAQGGTNANNAPLALTNLGIVQAAAFSGSDLGAKIQAACAANASTPVEIDVTQAAGTTQATPFDMSVCPGSNLKFTEGGIYSLLATNVVGPNSVISGIGPQVELQIAANQIGGMFQTASGSTAASYVTFTNLTMDGNQANEPSTCSSSTYNCSFGVYVNSVAAAAPNHIVIDGVLFQNWYGFPVWIYEGEVGSTPNPYASYIWVENSLFNNTKKEAIRSYGVAGHVHIRNNSFWNYGNLGGGNWDAIYWADTLASSCPAGNASLSPDWTIADNRFYNTAGETKFATEMYGGTLACSFIDGFHYTNNFANGEGYGGGIGLSSSSQHADISGNIFTDCTLATDRCGIEGPGSHSVISHNVFDYGAIQFYSGTYNTSGNPLTDVSITGNTIKSNTDNGTGSPGIYAITAANNSILSNINIVGNTIDMSPSACTNNSDGIEVGAQNSGALVTQVNVSDNTIIPCNGTGGNGIRVEGTNSGTTQSVDVFHNLIVGGGSSQNGILDSDTGDTVSDLRIYGNHVIGTTTPINISLPSSQYDEWGNVTSTTQQGFNSLNGYSVGPTQVINSNGVVLPNELSTYNPVAYTTAAQNSSISFGAFTAQAGMIVTQVEYFVSTAPSGCTSAPLLTLQDFTLGQAVPGTTLSITGSTGSSGAISEVLTAGHEYGMEFYMPNNTATCSTYPSNPEMTIQVTDTSNNLVRSGFYALASTGYFAPFMSDGSTLTRIDTWTQNAPVGCSVQPTMSLYDATAAATVLGTTFNITAIGSSSGTISVMLTSGHNYEWQLTAGTGCSRNVADVNVIAQSSSPTPSAAYAKVGGWVHGTIANTTTYTFGSFTPLSNLFVSNVAVSFETAFSGCSANPTVDLYDATASAVVSGSSATTTGQQSWLTGLTGYLTAGHQYEVQVVGGTGCGTAGANAYVTFTYNVNNGGLVAGNNLADVPNKSAALNNLITNSSSLNTPLTAPGYYLQTLSAGPVATYFDDFFTATNAVAGALNGGSAESCNVSTTYLDQSHPGNIVLISGTAGSGTGVDCFYTGIGGVTNGRQIYTPNSSLGWTWGTAVYVAVLPGTTAAAYQAGMVGSPAVSPWTTGIGWYLSSANGTENDWYCEYGSTYTDSGIAATVAWVRLNMVNDGTYVHWYVNGVEATGCKTAIANVPSTTMFVGAWTDVGLSATTNMAMAVDYIYFQRTVSR